MVHSLLPLTFSGYSDIRVELLLVSIFKISVIYFLVLNSAVCFFLWKNEVKRLCEKHLSRVTSRSSEVFKDFLSSSLSLFNLIY